MRPLAGDELVALARRVASDEGLECASAVPLSDLDDSERLEAWLRAGHAGTMGYLERHAALRGRPAEHFPPHLSALVFLARYEVVPPQASAAVGNIARYARGDDYHRVLRRGLDRVAAVLRARDPELEARPCVDTAPVHEKIAAARSGLGWQGKNTNVLRAGVG
jgi:epoxyqueuosine reductase